MIAALAQMLIFPGFLFLTVFGFACEYLDRKVHARLQNRVGPPWFQPVADFIKLAAKEDIIPEDANPRMFKMMPVFALTSTVTAFFYIPLWNMGGLYSFTGDLVVVLYLLTIPTLSFFLGGWYSTSIYSKIGAVRSITQLFAYEVPLFVSILSSALLAGTWSLREMTAFYAAHPWYWAFNLLGFFVSLVAFLGKLEKVPFDIAEAETEIVAGTFTEYSGRLLAFFRLGLDIEAIVGASLLAAVFLPFGLALTPILGFVVYVLKVLFIILLMTLARSVFARLRIDQMMELCWKYVAPLAFLQLIIVLIIKGALLK